MRGDPARRRGRDDRRRDRRLPRPALVGEARAARSLAASIPVWVGVWVHSFTFPLVGVHALPAWIGAPLTVVAIVAVMNMVNFLDGLDGLAAGVCAISALSFCADRALARPAGRGDPDRDRLRRVPRLPAPQLLSGADLHGRLRRAAARVHARVRLRRRGCSRPPPWRRSCCRCSCSRCRCSTRRSSSRGGSSTASRSTSADRQHLHHRFENIGFSQRRAVVYLYAWCATLALAALATRFVHPHRARRLERDERGDRRRRRPARARRVGLRRLPARDREARESVHPPPRGARARRAERASIRVDVEQSRRDLRAGKPLPLSRTRRHRVRYAPADGAGRAPIRFRLIEAGALLIVGHARS